MHSIFQSVRLRMRLLSKAFKKEKNCSIPVLLSIEQLFSCWTLEAHRQLEFHLVYSRPSTIQIKTKQNSDQKEPYFAKTNLHFIQSIIEANSGWTYMGRIIYNGNRRKKKK